MDDESCLRQGEILGAGLAPLWVDLDLEVHPLSLSKSMKTCPLGRANVNKYIAAAVVGLNESKALLSVEPLHYARSHVPPKAQTRISRALTRFQKVNPAMSLEKGRLDRSRRHNGYSNNEKVYTLFEKTRVLLVGHNVTGQVLRMGKFYASRQLDFMTWAKPCWIVRLWPGPLCI